MDPSFGTVYIVVTRCYLALGRLDAALEAAETYSELSGPSVARPFKALVYAYMGKKDEAKKLLAESEAEFPGGQGTPFHMAAVWFKLGEKDRGFEWLEKAYDHHDRYIFLMAVEKELEEVRSDPRYLSLLRKTGLEGLVRG
jgi:tetratricopeptide (TPR) repeat protein